MPIPHQLSFLAFLAMEHDGRDRLWKARVVDLDVGDMSTPW